MPYVESGVLYAWLRAEGDGVLGDGPLPVPKDDPRYAALLAEAEDYAAWQKKQKETD